MANEKSDSKNYGYDTCGTSSSTIFSSGSALSSSAATRGFLCGSVTTGLEVATQNYMEKYSDRLETFKTYPVKPYHPRPSELAALGFYYVGPHDRVRCFSCNIDVHNFEEMDLVLNEHYRWSCGNCAYLKHIENFKKQEYLQY
jgi:hypothetical protein